MKRACHLMEKQVLVIVIWRWSLRSAKLNDQLKKDNVTSVDTEQVCPPHWQNSGSRAELAQNGGDWNDWERMRDIKTGYTPSCLFLQRKAVH